MIRATIRLKHYNVPPRCLMSLVSRPRLVAPILFGLMLLAAAPAFAQVDLTGVWNPRFDEDNPERLAGPSLVEFLGIPINDYARQ